MSKVKLIAVSPKNYESLRKWGEYGDSMNSIISKVLDKVDAMPNEKNRVTGEPTQQQTQEDHRTKSQSYKEFDRS